jgi:CHAD domain-containing protein
MVMVEHRGAKKAVKTMGSFLDSLAKVRKAAGLVRDLDVQRKIVSRLGRQLVRDRQEEATDDVKDDLEELHKHLRKERKSHAHCLRKLLSAFERPLRESLEDCEDKLASLQPGKTTPHEHAKNWLAACRHRGRFRDPDDLHEFRKETKGVRYIAELQPELKSSIALANDVRAMNDAIGAWHDYEVLVEEAKSWIGKKSAVTKIIYQRRDQKWKRALYMVAAIRKRHAALFQA